MSFVKWVSLSSLGAFALIGGLYLTVPSVLEGEVSTPTVAAKGDYSRTLYGVPKLKMDHYRLNEDNYFDLQIEGVLNIGRTDPVEMPLWKSRLDKLHEALGTKKGANNSYAKNEALRKLIGDVVVLNNSGESVDDVTTGEGTGSEASSKEGSSFEQAEKSVEGTGTLKDTTSEVGVDGNEVENASSESATSDTVDPATVDPATVVTPTGNENGEDVVPVDETSSELDVTENVDGASGVVNMGETKNVTTVAPSNNK